MYYIDIFKYKDGNNVSRKWIQKLIKGETYTPITLIF